MKNLIHIQNLKSLNKLNKKIELFFLLLYNNLIKFGYNEIFNKYC